MGWVRSVNKQRTQAQAQYTGGAAAATAAAATTAAGTATGGVVRAKSRRVSNT